MTNPFAQPAQGDKFDLKNNGPAWLGKLFVFYPKAVLEDVPTEYGTATAVETDIIGVEVIDPATNEPKVWRGARLFSTQLVSQTKTRVGEFVLGRLGQGVNTKGNPPWLLKDFSDADVALALPWHQKYQAGNFQQPQAPATSPAWESPAVDPWQGMKPEPVTPPPAAAAPAPLDPVLAGFLQSKGIDISNLDPQTASLIAATLK